MLAIVWLISQKSRCNALRCASYGPNIDGFFGSLARVLEQHYGITGLPMKYIRTFRIDLIQNRSIPSNLNGKVIHSSNLFSPRIVYQYTPFSIFTFLRSKLL